LKKAGNNRDLKGTKSSPRQNDLLECASIIGTVAVILRSDRVFVRLAVIGLLAATLAGCGRKGGLDLPPGAAVDSSTALPQDSATSPSLMGSMTGNAASSKPAAPAGPNKRIPLDVLLN
jgi:predicted small lipoprotein YifL